MEPTLLAGPIEFTPAEIAGILAVLAAVFVIVMAPGWAVVGYAARRRRNAKGPGPTWPAALAGAFGGLLVCCAAAAVVGALLQDAGSVGLVAGVLAAWGACWGLSLRLTSGSAHHQAPGAEGWGR